MSKAAESYRELEKVLREAADKWESDHIRRRNCQSGN